jgi:Divergent 4Fe-4S mono-cluster
MPAPVASGWSGRRVGLAPTGKRRLVTAHVENGQFVIDESGASDDAIRTVVAECPSGALKPGDNKQKVPDPSYILYQSFDQR